MLSLLNPHHLWSTKTGRYVREQVWPGAEAALLTDAKIKFHASLNSLFISQPPGNRNHVWPTDCLEQGSRPDCPAARVYIPGADEGIQRFS